MEPPDGQSVQTDLLVIALLEINGWATHCSEVRKDCMLDLIWYFAAVASMLPAETNSFLAYHGSLLGFTNPTNLWDKMHNLKSTCIWEFELSLQISSDDEINWEHTLDLCEPKDTAIGGW